MKKTIVCVYGKGKNTSEVFARLCGLCEQSGCNEYIYCGIIDLPDWICYRSSGDSGTEDKVKRFVRYYGKRFGGDLFCAVRQRRYYIEGKEPAYCCVDGSLGALKSLWRFAGGRKEEFFPVYGKVNYEVLSEADKIYYSALLGNEAPQKRDIIEKHGLEKMENELTEGTVIVRNKKDGNPAGKAADRIFGRSRSEGKPGECLEILLSHNALDKLLSTGISEEDIEVKESMVTETENYRKKIFLPKKCRFKVIKKFPK